MESHVLGLPSEEADRLLEQLFKSLPIPRSEPKHKGERRIIYGVMSSDNADLEKDVINQTGIDLDMIAGKHGRLKWAHKEITGPTAIIGNLLGVRKAVSGRAMQALDKDGEYSPNKKYSLLVAEIFGEDSDLPVATDAWKTAKACDKSGKPLGFSIEGIPIDRNGKLINKSALVNVVLTPNPVNQDTRVHVLKGDILEKALSVTPISPDLPSRTGGAALQTDNFTNNPRRKEMDKNKKRGLAFDNPDELEGILDEQGFDEETMSKVKKALFKEIPMEEEELIDEEDKLKNKPVMKGVEALLGSMNKSLESIQGLLDASPDDLNDGFAKGFSPIGKDFEERTEEAIAYLGKGIDLGQSRDMKLAEGFAKAIEINKALNAEVGGLKARIAKLEKGIEDLSRQPDGFPEIANIIGSGEKSPLIGMSKGDLANRADELLRKGDLTSEEHSQVITAIRKPEYEESKKILKGLEEKIRTL